VFGHPAIAGAFTEAVGIKNSRYGWLKTFKLLTIGILYTRIFKKIDKNDDGESKQFSKVTASRSLVRVRYE